MSDPALAKRYRLHAAAYRDSTRGARFMQQIAGKATEALELLVHVLAHDVPHEPEDLDPEHVRDLLRTYLPGRLRGGEPYVSALPDLLEDFLMVVAEREGLNRAWEWTKAVADARDGMVTAMRDPNRPRYGSESRTEPDRRPGAKIGRNDPCFCGSGKKFKTCCGRVGT